MVKIFVVHGMGKHIEGWWTGDNGTQKKLEGLKRFDSLKGSSNTLESLIGAIDWKEVVYDDASERIRTAPEQEGHFDKLIADISGNSNSTVSATDLNNWKTSSLSLSSSLNLFNRTDFTKNNVWDVFLCANKLTRHYLALHIAEQILSEIKNNPDEPWGILAHSLGTALIQDALNLLYDLIGKNDFKTPPRVVGLIANFSRTKIGDILVSQNPASSDTAVWPSRSAKTSMCNYYISARHKLVPLSYLGDEMPDPWNIEPDGFTRSCYRVFEHKDLNFVPQEIDINNPVEVGSFNHSVENYFAHPKIHLPFLYRALGMGTLVTSSIEDEATKAFLKTRQPTAINFAQVIAQSDLSSLEAWIEALAKIGKNFNVGADT